MPPPPSGSPALDIVLFDIDDTLYSTTVFSERARRAAIRAMIERGLLVEEEEGMTELGEKGDKAPPSSRCDSSAPVSRRCRSRRR